MAEFGFRELLITVVVINFMITFGGEMSLAYMFANISNRAAKVESCDKFANGYLAYID